MLKLENKMVSMRDILKNLPKEKSKRSDGDMMANPDYIRKSSDLIKDALQKGLDVLQLDNGDIVTTGTKIIVNTWRFDGKSKKMVKVSSKEKGEETTKNLKKKPKKKSKK
jgi:hypothetical protein